MIFMNKSKKIILIAICIFVITLIPIKNKLWDGGSIEYRALVYKYTKIHKINEQSPSGYEEGWELKIFGVHVAGKTNISPSLSSKITTEKYDGIKNVIVTNLEKIHEVSDPSSSSTSSYTKNKYYDNIVNLGNEGLTILQEMIKDEKITGLDAEIIKHAIMDINNNLEK